MRATTTDIFPFMIHFTIAEGSTILVSAVLHTSLDPQKWITRGEE